MEKLMEILRRFTDGTKRRVLSFFRGHPAFLAWGVKAIKAVFPNYVIVLEYPVNPRPRWEEDSPHPELFGIINSGRESFRGLLEGFREYGKYFGRIAAEEEGLSGEPCWINEWLPGLDAITLYGFIASLEPRFYIEIGAGYSTRFARRAIKDQGLSTKIISIDPSPRAEIGTISDEVISKPVEEVGLGLFDELEEKDILFVDNSHRVLMNSDATTVLLDILPRLKKGVLVGFHDILLPYDYPEKWAYRFYSEQYLLAAYFLGEGKRLEIVLPNAFVSRDAELARVLQPLWQEGETSRAEKHGSSFWVRIN